MAITTTYRMGSNENYNVPDYRNLTKGEILQRQEELIYQKFEYQFGASIAPRKNKVFSTHVHDDIDNISSNSSSGGEEQPEEETIPLTTVSKTYTPLTTIQTQQLIPDQGYIGFSTVNITVNPMTTGSVITPSPNLTISPNISINDGKITANVSGSTNIRSSVNQGYITSSDINVGTITWTGRTTAAIPEEYVIPEGTVEITYNQTHKDIKQYAYADINIPEGDSLNNQTGVTRTYIPSTVQQTETISPDSNYTGLDNVEITVNAISTGSATTPATTITKNPTVTVSNGGLITAAFSTTKSITPTVVPGYITSGISGNIVVNGNTLAQLLTTPGSTITPSTVSQTAITSKRFATGNIIVAPIPDQWLIPTGSTTITSNINNFDVTPFASVNVNVPNIYTDNDEGKVVINNSLVSQTSTSFVSNGTYATTTHNEVVINVSDNNPVYSVTDTLDSAGGTIRSFTVNGRRLQSLRAIQNGTYTSPSSVAYNEVIVNVSDIATSLQDKTKTYTPSTVTQTQNIYADIGYAGLSTVSITVDPVSTDFVGTGITRRNSSDLTASGSTVTVPAGYYAQSGIKSISNGSVTIPSHNVTYAPIISVNNSTGLITASVNSTKNVTPSVAAGFITSASVTSAASVSFSGISSVQLSTASSYTVTPSTVKQTLPVSNKYMLGNVVINAITQGTNLLKGATWTSGYITNTGDISAPNTTLGRYEVYSSKINITPLRGKTLSFWGYLTGGTTQAMWVAIGYYDANNAFKARQAIISGVETIGCYAKYTVPSDCSSIVISFRTYGSIKCALFDLDDSVTVTQS